MQHGSHHNICCSGRGSALMPVGSAIFSNLRVWRWSPSLVLITHVTFQWECKQLMNLLLVMHLLVISEIRFIIPDEDYCKVWRYEGPRSALKKDRQIASIILREICKATKGDRSLFRARVRSRVVIIWRVRNQTFFSGSREFEPDRSPERPFAAASSL